MAFNTLDTRLQMKHDSLANWLKNDPILLAGEIAVAFIDTNANENGQGKDSSDLTPPAVGVKVGALTGDKKFSELPWIQAVAGDVYGWAKAEKKPEYAASEIGGINKYIKDYVETDLGISVDTNTQYQLVKVDDYNYKLQAKEKDGAWADVAGSAIIIPKDTLTTGTANGTVAFNGEDVAVHGLKSAAYTEASAYATAAQGTKADSAIQSATLGGVAFTKTGDALSMGASEARTALGLGTVATTDASAYATAEQGTKADSALQQADIAEGATNGTIKVKGTDVTVHGLGSAAYTDATAYATKAQGDKADTAVQSVVAGENNGTIKVDNTEVAITGLKSAAFTEASAYATSAQGSKADSAVQKVTVLGKELTDGSSVTVEEAKTALGLGSAAYEDASAFDAAGAAAAVLGTAADEATANTVYGAKAAAAKAQSDIDAFFAAADKGPEAIDTLKEIQDFLTSDEGGVKALLDSVAENKAAIEDVVDGTTKVASAANADVAAKASGLDAAGEAAVKAIKVDNATNADQLGGVVAANYLLKSDAPGYGDILTKTNAATLYQPVGEYASAAQGAKADTAVQPAVLNSYYTKTEADAAFMDSTETDSAIDAKIAALKLGDTYEPKGAASEAVNALDSSVAATAAEGNVYSVLTGITQTDGKLTAKTEVKLSAIAKTGNVMDLVQTPGDYLVFNCGTSSTVI